ncbi:hypothetical protein D3C87_1826030 [compost metagenome]
MVDASLPAKDGLLYVFEPVEATLGEELNQAPDQWRLVLRPDPAIVVVDGLEDMLKRLVGGADRNG